MVDKNNVHPSQSLRLKTRLTISLLNLIHFCSLRPDGTINRRLVSFFDRQSPPNPTPIDGVSSHDILVDAARNLWFRLFVPEDPPRDDVGLVPVIVFFHGGGFGLWSPATTDFDALCRRFAGGFKAVVLSVNYRLIPEHKFPAQYDDGFDVIKFIDENHISIDRWPHRADLGRCFLAGDSAGANLAHHVAVRIGQNKEMLKKVKLTGLILLQPFFGGEERTGSEIRFEAGSISKRWTGDWAWKAFLPDGLNRDHWAVNVSGPNAVDISGFDFPPVMLLVGGLDPLRDWQLRYHEWLKRMGKEVVLLDVPNWSHGFYMFPEVSESEMVMAEVKAFIHKQCGRRS